jgi:hypothetical protein
MYLWEYTYGALQLSEAAFFKVSFLTLSDGMVLSYQLVDRGLDHALKLILGVGLRFLARLCEGLLNGVGQRSNLGIDLGIGVHGLLTLNCLGNFRLLESEK